MTNDPLPRCGILLAFSQLRALVEVDVLPILGAPKWSKSDGRSMGLVTKAGELSAEPDKSFGGSQAILNSELGLIKSD